MKILESFDIIKKEFAQIVSTVEFTICPLVNCLLETQCIQLRSEEQDDFDRQKIALYGYSDLIQKTAEQQAHKEKSFMQAQEAERQKEASPRYRRKKERENSTLKKQ